MLNRRLVIATVLLTIFLDFFNVGLIYPIFSSLVYEDLFSLGVSPFFQNALFGVLIGAFPFGQLFGAPIIGQLSDHYGRRKLFLLSLIGTVLTLAFCGFGILGSSLILLLVGRLLGGLMAGNMTLAYASLADLSSESEKVKDFALVPFTISAGFAMGPFVAGYLANPELGSWAGPALPFWVAAFLSLINLALIALKFPKGEPSKQGAIRLAGIGQGLKNLGKIFTPTPIRPYFWILFLMITSNFLFVQFIGPFAIDRFKISVVEVGYLYTNVGLSAAIGNLFLTRRLSSLLSPEKSLSLGLVSLAAFLLLLLFAPSVLVVHVATVFIMLACAVAYTNSMAIVSNRGGEGKQGETMGVAVSIQNCSEFFPAFLMGLVASFSQNIPMLVAALAAVGSYSILRAAKSPPVCSRN